MELKKIVIVSSGQPSANPRLTKEAIALDASGYNVTVIYSPISPWADKYDSLLFRQYKNITWVKAGYHSRNDAFRYLISRVRKKAHGILNRIFIRPDLSVKAITLFSQELIQETCRRKADLYIGHNIGALPAVVNAAHFHHAKSLFDFEDYHRGEDVLHSAHVRCVTRIENEYVPKVMVCSTSSPLITKQYSELFAAKSFFTVLNCFSIGYQKKHHERKEDDNLKLFWFSQYVGKNRGLETILKGIAYSKSTKIRLTLLGNCNDGMKDYFNQFASSLGLGKEQLMFIGPVEESLIVEIASDHHIGICAEIPKVVNRDICLANKIFMYLLAGNALFLSNTRAHAAFLAKYHDTGMVYNHDDAAQIGDLLNGYMNDGGLLEVHRRNSYDLGKKELNWEVEGERWLQQIRSLLA